MRVLQCSFCSRTASLSQSNKGISAIHSSKGTIWGRSLSGPAAHRLVTRGPATSQTIQAVFTGGAGLRSDTRSEGQWRLYAALGIERDVSVKEVKSAYRQLARIYHPDVCAPEKLEECIQKFLEIQIAYEVLVDPIQRAQYDYEQAHPSVARRRHASNVGHPWQRCHRPWEAMRPQEWASVEEREETVSAWRSQVHDQLSGLKARAAAKQAWREQQQQQQRPEQEEPAEGLSPEEYGAYSEFAS